ncbi:hypothetical protein [Ferrovum sp.]|uniref:hypothetical protein n=1 Tax=Ferrovum sp. TaxID=2609467 RepID=UPI002637B5CA|nr:hypothetical protein [Ferrovum sp.]
MDKIENELMNPVEYQDSPVVKGVSDVTLAVQDVDDEAKKIKDAIEGELGHIAGKIGIPGGGV